MSELSPEQVPTAEEAAPQQSQTPIPAATPAVPAASKPIAVPSPAAFAHHRQNIAAPIAAPSTVSYSEQDVLDATRFGRVDEIGTVFVKENDTERKVGEYPGTNPTEALDLFVHRFIDLKSKLESFATRLNSPKIKTREIDESLATLEKETASPDVVGDIDSLRKRFEEIKTLAQTKSEELVAARKAAVEKAIEHREAIAKQAEDLASKLSDSTNWKATADIFTDLFAQWQKIQREDIRIDRSKADALWKRFSTARSTFNQARRRWAQARDTQRGEVRTAKEAIIAQAEAIQNSTAWVDTSRKFNDLMTQWKQAGRIGHQSEDDALWMRFRAAADTFFDARQADRDSMNADEKENLTKKEELAVKAEALLPVTDEKSAAAARKQLSLIQDQWEVIGRVPRADMNHIEARLSAVEKQIKAVEDAAWSQKDPETSARKSSFSDQLTSQLTELDAKIATETDAGKKKALEAEKATKQQWLNAIQ